MILRTCLIAFLSVVLSVADADALEKMMTEKVTLNGWWVITKANCHENCDAKVVDAAKKYIGKGIKLFDTHLDFPANTECLDAKRTSPASNYYEDKLFTDNPVLQKLAMSEDIVAYRIECRNYAFDLYWLKHTNAAFILTDTTGVQLSLRKASEAGTSTLLFTKPFDSELLAFEEPIMDGSRTGDIVFQGKASSEIKINRWPLKPSTSGKGNKCPNTNNILYYGTDRILVNNGSDILNKYEDKRSNAEPQLEYGCVNMSNDGEKMEYLNRQSSSGFFFRNVQNNLRESKINNKEVLVYVHGANNSFEGAAKLTAYLADKLGFKRRVFFFSWPTPTFEWYSLTTAPFRYLEAETNQAFATRHLTEFLRKLVAQFHVGKIYLIAHSMGTNVLSNALKEIANEMPKNLPKFKHIFLVAPDIDVEDFKKEVAPVIKAVSRRISIYYSSKDWALTVSRGLHTYSRLGLIEESNDDELSSRKNISIAGIDMRNATRAESEDGSIHHSYLKGLIECIKADIYSISLKGSDCPDKNNSSVFKINP